MVGVRLALRLLGLALVAAALVFVGLRIAEYVENLGAVAASGAAWATVAIGAALYGALSLLLALAWQLILGRAGPGTAVRLIDSFTVYGRSQIAKYVPGNVFHFFGRQLLGRDVGWAQGAIAVASVVETLLLGSAAAALLLLLGSIDRPALFDFAAPGTLLAGAVLATVGPVLLLRYGARLPGLRRLGFLTHAEGLGHPTVLAPPFVIYAAFFMTVAVVFWFVVGSTFDLTRPALITGIAAAFVSGWLIGNVTPSAPGGIGVREAVMLPQLSVLIGEPQAVVVVVMFRLVTIGGDVLFFLVATALATRRRSPEVDDDQVRL